MLLCPGYCQFVDLPSSSTALAESRQIRSYLDPNHTHKVTTYPLFLSLLSLLLLLLPLQHPTCIVGHNCNNIMAS